MFPFSTSEQLMYSTARITASDGSTGTGFFFQFKFGEMAVPIIITNKHVVNYNEDELVSFKLHTGSFENQTIDSQSLDINFKTNWIFHETHDLCFCYLNPLITQIKQSKNKDVIYFPINEEIIYTSSKLENLSAIEDVIMVGYPKGLWNEKDNLPLFRKGITSSHPAIDFNNKGVGVVDMACFPGSSGSPIFILNENGYSDKKGSTYLGSKRLIFLGILYAGPILTIDGEVVTQPQQNLVSKSSIMINLGYYVKSNELLYFKEIIKRHADL